LGDRNSKLSVDRRGDDGEDMMAARFGGAQVAEAWGGRRAMGGGRRAVGSGSRRGDYDMALHTDEGPGDGLVHAALYGHLAGHVQETRRGRPARQCGRYSMPAVMPAPHPWRQSRHHSTTTVL
jgi:hypothetical protein